MKTLIILLIALHPAITSCGSVADAINNASDKAVSASQTHTGTSVATSTDTTASVQTTTVVVPSATPAEASKTSAVEVKVNVDVKVGASSTTQSAARADGAAFSSKLVTWNEAVKEAPKGYRLAERFEVVDLIDAHKLPANTEKNETVWTANETGASEAFFVSLNDGQTTSANKLTKLFAIYVVGE